MRVALAALIGAYQEVRGGDALRATLPIAGHALVEHQARQAARAGARHVVLVVERVPAPLTAAIDRLRRTGLRIEVARDVADAADRIHPDERLLVIADGLVPDQLVLDRLAGAAVPTIVTVPADAEHGAYERVDATARWGGLLLTDGARLRATAAMLGDWDLQSTLLRRTIQDEPKRIEATRGELSLVDRPEAIDAVRQTLLLATRGRARGWPARFLYAPLEEIAAGPLLKGGADPLSIRAVAIALLIVAALAFFLDWRWLGIALAILAGGVDAVARRLARLRLEALTTGDPAGFARAIAAVLVLLAAAASLARTGGWGCWALAGFILFAHAAFVGEEAALRLRSGPAARRPLWLADEDALVLVAAVASAAAGWVAAAVIVAAYSAVSLLWLQRLARAELLRVPV